MRIKIAIGGMHCDACVQAVKTALEHLPGAKMHGVRVGEADLTFDETGCGQADVLAAVRNAGSFRIDGFTTST